jgi:hypothetical protein
MSLPRNLNTEQQAVTATPVGIPVGLAGLDLRDGAASRSPLSLRECTNARFVHDRSLAKRSGHDLLRMKTDDVYPQVDVEETRPWLYGWGDLSYQAYSSAAVKPPYFPEQVRGAGVALLDDQVVGYTGDRLLVRRPTSSEWTPSKGDLALMPTAVRRDRVYPNQDATNLNSWYDTAVSTLHEVTLYVRQSGANYQMYTAVRDRESGAILSEDTAIGPTSANLSQGYVVYSDGYFVAIWCDGTDLRYSHATDAEPTVWANSLVWDTYSGGAGAFDVEVISDTEFLVAFRDGTAVRITYWRGRDQQSTPVTPGTALTTIANAGGILAVAVGRDRDIGLTYQVAAGTNRFEIHTASGTRRTYSAAYGSSAPRRMAIAAHWNYSAAGGTQFTAWQESTSSAGLPGNVARVNQHFYSSDKADNSSAVSALFSRVFYNAALCTRGFRVGDIAVVGMSYTREFPATPSFQNQNFFLGTDWQGRQRVVASFLRGETVGYPDLFANALLRVGSVRPEPGQGYGSPETPTNTLWVTSMFRWPPVGLLNVFSPQIRQCIFYMDFLPQFRWAQYGRALYFPGAVVHEFDGRDCFEAGFLVYPEVQQVVSSAAGGALAAGDIRAYRIYACHANAGGEIARSPAVTFIAPAVGPGNNTNTVTFTPIQVTSKPANEIFFEIYATTGAAGPGATFYLLTRSVNNTFSSAVMTYVDTVGDATLQLQAADPHPAVPGLPGELLESAPPGCEIIVGGKSRLWFAGGELPPGRVAFSKLREETEQVGWSALVGLADLDSTGRPITSLACQSDVLVAFQSDAIYGLQGDGPSNLGSGFFPPAQLLAAGVGTYVHEGTVTSEPGTAFWTTAGPRLLTPGFQIQDVSQEVEPVARTMVPTAAVAHPGLREIRWYTQEGTALMWDYSARGPAGNRWSLWYPLRCASAAYYPLIDGAVICQPDGAVLLENQEVYTDGGNHYEFAWRTGDIRPSELLQGRNRFIQFALTGEYRGPCTLGVHTYYDNARMWHDYFNWVPETYLGPGWGTGTGTWGQDPPDNTTWIDPATQSPDGVFRFSRKIPRDKASTLSIRVSDQSAPNDSLVIDEVALLIAPETGIAQTPPRTFGPAEI